MVGVNVNAEDAKPIEQLLEGMSFNF